VDKVTSPHYVTPTLRRARLIDWLNESAECRAVVIAADAGYGKTTLLWQWEREVEFPCYWYKLDRNDRDWSLHISYLIESISQRHAGFGRRAHSMLEQMGGPGSSRPGVAAFLLAEMYERLTEPCTFIIDDWQFVASVTEVRGLWNQILRDAPPTCRFIFLSRAKPHLQFARFKTHGGYAEMRTDALRFNDREIDELFRDIYNDPLDATELAELERRTEGWAASLQLVEVSLRERRTPEERRSFIQSITATTDSDLVEFLAEEVLDQQPTPLRQFLLTTSILHRITPELASRLSGSDDGARILTDLEGRGLFIYRLGSQDSSYRYHGLFRGFLERRLTLERAPGEVAALHIHAASYFETTQSWPEAIHHYLKAGLQPQAARLIAKYGDDLATAGRLPILEEWLAQLPARTIADNARLSLLQGEISGLRGEWESAVRSLERSRHYFARKGDRRMQAVAYSKLSTVYSNLGDAGRARSMAEDGLLLASEDDVRTRLRLRGNLAITATWLDSLERAEHECERVAVEAAANGLEHYAAIAHHNLGIVLLYAGRISESIAHFRRAALVWDASTANPFADNSELVQALLVAGQPMEAATIAEAAVARTRPWVRANAEAWLGVALVDAYRGRTTEAINILRRLLLEHDEHLGSVGEKITALLVESLYLQGTGMQDLEDALARLEAPGQDPRLRSVTSVASALAAHRLGRCTGQCHRASDVLEQWNRHGSTLIAALGRLPLSLLIIEHTPRIGIRGAIQAMTVLSEIGALHYASRWLGRYVAHGSRLCAANGGTALLPRLIQAAPEEWIPCAVGLLPSLKNTDRANVLSAIEAAASTQTVKLIGLADGLDVQELRRRLVNRFAQRIYIRSFGPMTIHRGSWESPGILVTRKRMRLLLGLMIAAHESGLARDEVLDSLWPDSDPASAVNSLNQTVFQLRRLFESDKRDGDAPQYVLSSVDSIRLNPDLVRTDLEELREISKSLGLANAGQHRAELGSRLLALVRGEFLNDLRYEDWVTSAQLAVHADVRACLMPIADGTVPELGEAGAVKAGRILTLLDPYDEAAHIAIVRSFAGSGRRHQAKEILTAFAKRIQDELDEEPSPEMQRAAAMVGADIG